MYNSCPTVWISSCLSPISIFLGGKLARLHKLTRHVSLSEGCLFSLLFFLGWGVFCSSVWFCMVSGLRVDIGSRCMPTGWQGHWPKDKAFSTSAVCFCFAQQHSAPTVSLHFALYFAIFQTHIIKEKHWESYLWPSVSILIY